MDRKELKRLARFESDTPILSVYLDVDPTKRTSDEYLLSLRHLLEQVAELASSEDMAAVQRFFEHEYDWSGRGAVVFSCDEADFWHTYTLAVPVSSGVTIARRPYLSPLAKLIDAYGQYVVAMINRKGVSLVAFQLGELVDEQSFAGEDVRRLKRGRGSSGGPGRRGGAPASSRHENEAALRNLREAAKITNRFCRKHKPQSLIIAGAEPITPRFRELLPKALQEKVLGPLSIDPSASSPEIARRSLELLQKVEEERKAKLTEAVLTAAAKGREGAIGLDQTLSAAHEGRIKTLVIDRNYHAQGYGCDNCNYLTTQEMATCPFCGGTFIEIQDAAEAAVTKVIEEGGEIEVIDENPQLKKAGIGALLRY